ncbi:MAG: 50S ribosomal protein L4, partial [Candidatus Omnitrophica bacterium]|nr:50S ribosomal protein L4 [Candidatus Omnitrophota bacterium]
MPKAPLYKQDGTTSGEIDLSDGVFGVEFKPELISQVVVAQRANLRQNNRMTKTRGMVRGGGAKPWRQKGTGRARQGSIRAPHWVGGGHAFGGQKHNSHQDIPRKMNRGALKSALSEKVRNENLKVLDQLEVKEIKTKTVAAVLTSLGLGRG